MNKVSGIFNTRVLPLNSYGLISNGNRLYCLEDFRACLQISQSVLVIILLPWPKQTNRIKNIWWMQLTEESVFNWGLQFKRMSTWPSQQAAWQEAGWHRTAKTKALKIFNKTLLESQGLKYHVFVVVILCNFQQYYNIHFLKQSKNTCQISFPRR